MKAAVGLLLMVLRVSHGVETHCDGRLDGAQCYGALGGTMVLQLMDNISEIPRYYLLKGKQQILFGKKNNIIHNTMESRSIFIPSNGTFLINNLKRTDGGKYSLKLQDSDGEQTGTLSLQLFIQAPVSSVLLRSECLSEGQMKVSCSSEGGDSPQYSWTLDGRTLTDTELLSGTKETNIIILKQNILGHLVCSVRNNVSLSSNEKDIKSCGFVFINCTSNGTHIEKWVLKENNTLCIEPTTVPTTIKHSSGGKETESFKPSTTNTSPNQTAEPLVISKEVLSILVGVLSVLLIVLFASVTLICTRRKKQIKKEEEEADDQELTYADVKVVQRQARRMEQSAQEEVEYGQVKFTKHPQRSEPAADDCVYAKVRKGR